MQRHFRMFADYNRWANRRIYTACAQLSDEDYRADAGAFFGSAHRTLNHLLVADRIWMRRITGQGEAPDALDLVLFEDFDDLKEARAAEDERIIDFIDGFTEDRLRGAFTYTTLSNPTTITQPLGPVLSHVFNHQTHHRGQVHTVLTSFGQPSPVLDLIYFLRGDGSCWL